KLLHADVALVRENRPQRGKDLPSALTDHFEWTGMNQRDIGIALPENPENRRTLEWFDRFLGPKLALEAGVVTLHGERHRFNRAIGAGILKLDDRGKAVNLLTIDRQDFITATQASQGGRTIRGDVVDDGLLNGTE